MRLSRLRMRTPNTYAHQIYFGASVCQSLSPASLKFWVRSSFVLLTMFDTRCDVNTASDRDLPRPVSTFRTMPPPFFPPNGAKVEGRWIAQDWQWDGEVRDFQFDGSWDWQVAPGGYYDWWVAGNYSMAGAKTEHCSSDPRPNKSGFVQGSTAGYFGHLYVEDPKAALQDGLPEYFDGTYYVYQGELDVTEQIKLGGKGKYATLEDGIKRDATKNWDDPIGNPEGKVTFEDIDGLEVIMAKNQELYVILQEDSGNDLGERMFISKLEHKDNGKELKYYLSAISGGSLNTRMTAGVSVPAGTSCGGSSHEFSGVFDLSGLLYKNDDGTFKLPANHRGFKKREAEAKVDINDKDILIGLQAHNLNCGIIDDFDGDRGGQWYVYKPNIPH